MLRIGLTGGIGAGKSAVSAVFAGYGAVVVDGDVIAREVVEPGTEGLTKLVEVFGTEILLPDGTLDRPALAARAFGDDEARATLNSIVHPLVGRRRAEIIAAVPDDTVVVEDIPLLVESRLAPLFPLVIVVHTDLAERVRRLVEDRGMSRADAEARIAAQAGDDERRAVADVWLDNSGTRDQLIERCREVWQQRISPFAENLRMRRPAPLPDQPVPPDPDWPAQGRRIVARLATACGHRAARIEHIGPTAAATAPTPDVIDVEITPARHPGRAGGRDRLDDLADLTDLDDLDGPLLQAGYPRLADSTGAAAGVRYASADPGRPTRVHIAVDR